MTNWIVHLITMSLLCFLTRSAIGADVVPRIETSTGKVYENVKWGPVDGKKVVVFHNRGVSFVPLEELPIEFQNQLGHKAPDNEDPPTPAPPKVALTAPSLAKPLRPFSPSADLFKPAPPIPPIPPAVNNSPEWRTYNQEKNLKLLLDGKLVDKSNLFLLTGFVVATGTLSETGPNGSTKIPITTLELAKKKNDAVASMQMRPGLWKGTKEEVILLNYRPPKNADGLLTLYVKETNTVEEGRAFLVAEEPTFEQWRTLRNPKSVSDLK